MPNKKKELNDKFIKAATTYELKKAKKYLKQGADVDAKDHHGYTSLINTVIYLHDTTYVYETLKFLFDNGANINMQSDSTSHYYKKFTALDAAVSHNLLNMTQFLLSQPNIIQQTKDEALLDGMQADRGYIKVSKKGYNDFIQIIYLLLENDANPNYATNENNTSLIYAIVNKHAEIIPLLLRFGADIYFKNNDNLDALTLAQRPSKFYKLHQDPPIDEDESELTPYNDNTSNYAGYQPLFERRSNAKMIKDLIITEDQKNKCIAEFQKNALLFRQASKSPNSPLSKVPKDILIEILGETYEKFTQVSRLLVARNIFTTTRSLGQKAPPQNSQLLKILKRNLN